MIFDRAGRPLWLGRNRRLGNAALRLAVAIRDGGCCECGAPMHRYDLHHIQKWHRDGGCTDIEKAAIEKEPRQPVWMRHGLHHPGGLPARRTPPSVP